MLLTKKKYVTLSVDKLEVKGAASVGKMTAQAVEAGSGYFKGGISIGATSLNNVKWKKLSIDGREYTVLINE